MVMRKIEIDLAPEELHDGQLTRRAIERAAGRGVWSEGEEWRMVRRSIDCRRRAVVYHCMVEVGCGAQPAAAPHSLIPNAVRPDARRVVIVGGGPAGLFAALRALQLGLCPIVVERGKPVEERMKDIVAMVRTKVVNPDSNWCFGEGGAGTYSDGKLYTRSTKRGDVGAVLQGFVAHGADPDIMLDAHAHIGTDRLPAIVSNMRHTIVEYGGEYHFGMRMTDLMLRDGRVRGVVCEEVGAKHPLPITFEGDAVVLATGHSARDVYALFDRKGWLLEAKDFAIGVRVEHPQELINQIQYHGPGYSPLLPPAAYSLTTQALGHGVFSFCMCPGGVIVPAATAGGQQVVNGMSNAARNSAYANSGIAVTVSAADIGATHPLALLEFQQAVEQRAFEAAGGCIDAPAQRLVDFMKKRSSSSLIRSNYMGHCTAAPLHEVLPPFVTDSLVQGFRDFDRKMRGFVTEEAMLLAVESRTSSPVRIPRQRDTLQHPQIEGLYPCGEGAGYAGGIVSSALDGIRCIEAISLRK